MRIEYISTKFYIPVAPDRYVVRQRLVDKLKYQEGIRLSLLTAPAGFGKTTTVIQLIKDVNSGQDHRFSKVAWLSLDEHDNGLVEFVSYFIGAVQQVEKDFAYDLQISILSGQRPAISYVAKELINQLASLDAPLHFVLDDFYVINDLKISELMNLVVEYLPPHIHFIITSRKPVELDLPRWRGRGWLNEVEAKHLRFTLPETEAFLYNTMQLAESNEIAPALQDHTGGWVVGLQLAAFSIRESEDYQDFLALFGGGTKYISDYLMAEVFAKQTSQIQDFLLKTSITDKFTAALCAAIVNIDVGLAHTILEELEKSDLFVITLDDEGHWFQYHKIFLEFLENSTLDNR
jgi:LuxR family maltose regulon positive regulatory protein